MDEAAEFKMITDLIKSLDAAFLARQGKGEWQSDRWGERFFTVLEQDHAEWTQETTGLYDMARRLLWHYALEQIGTRAVYCLYLHPEDFVHTVVSLLRKPSHSNN